jgi:hypothetical protein
MLGHRAFLADQNCPYDVAVDVDGRLIRIQVKSTRKPKALPQRVGHFPAYMWNVRRAGKGGVRVYADGEFDLLACVALDVRKVAYLPPSKQCQTVHIRTHDDPAPPAHGGKANRAHGFSGEALTRHRLGLLYGQRHHGRRGSESWPSLYWN